MAIRRATLARENSSPRAFPVMSTARSPVTTAVIDTMFAPNFFPPNRVAALSASSAEYAQHGHSTNCFLGTERD